tara:strand:- start:2600 stop:2986 length:387 start_codon:yes stop_codon:yes gene_type:complete
MDYLVERTNKAMSLLSVIIMGSIGVALFFSSTTDFIVAFGSILIFGAILFPLSMIDVSDDIPEIKNFKKNNPERKDLKIKHPRKGLIIFLVIAGFFTFGLCSLIAVIVGSGTLTVRIPENIVSEVGLK